MKVVCDLKTRVKCVVSRSKFLFSNAGTRLLVGKVGISAQPNEGSSTFSSEFIVTVLSQALFVKQ